MRKHWYHKRKKYVFNEDKYNINEDDLTTLRNTLL